MVRLVGIGLLSIALAMPGFILSEKLSRRRKYLSFFADMALRFSGSIFDGGDSVFQMIQRETDLKYQYLMNINKNIISDRQSLECLFRENCIENEDITDLVDFFNYLGTSDSILQKKHCERFYSRFESKLYDAKEQCLNKGKVYKSLFVSLGLIVFIILI